MLLLASALLILDLTQRSLTQSTASLFIPSFGDVSLQGAEAGVGTDGTTFVLSGSFTTDSFVSPFTMTLVEGASQVAEIAAVRTGLGQDDVVGIGVECELSGTGKEADCVQVFTFAGIDRATTLQGSISVQSTVVAIIDAQTGSAPGASSSAGNGSGETSSTSGPGPVATGMSTQTAPVVATTTQINAPPTPTKSSAVARRHSLVQSVAMIALVLFLLYTFI